MQLQKLLQNIQASILRQTPCALTFLEQDIKRVTLDSRTIKPGVIFVASPGATDNSQDGHAFIKQAQNQKASCIIIENENYLSPCDHDDIPIVLVKNSRIAAAQLNEALYQHPSLAMDIYGVTGTNGKTTVSFLTASILQTAGKKCAVLGTLGVGSTDHLNYFGMTTPEAEVLSPMLHDLQSDSYESVVMEVSSHALSTHRVDGINFKAAAFTNLSVDHLDFHKTFDDYRKAKNRLFTKLLPAQNFAILPEQNPLVHKLKSKNHPILTWGYSASADISALDLNQNTQGLLFTLVIKGQKVTVQSNFFGSYNLDNMLCAAGLSFASGISIEAIAQGLSCALPPPGRTEHILSQNPLEKPTVLIDFAHTPDALKQVLTSIKEFTKGRLIVVFGCGGDRDKSKRPQMGSIATSLADMTFITSDNPRHEDPLAIIDEISSGINPDKKNNCLLVVDRKTAILQAITSAKPDDVVVIAGKGHEKTQQIGEVFYPFDDSTIARSILETWHR